MPYKNPEKEKEYHKQYNKEWDKKNADRRKEINKKHNKKRQHEPYRVIQLSEVRYRRHHRNKVKVLEMYGTCCNYCKTEVYEFLCVDHINEDGAEHRKTKEYKRLNVGGMWGYLAMTEFRPDLYQILCASCNHAKHYYGVRPGIKSFIPLSEWKQISKLKRKENGH